MSGDWPRGSVGGPAPPSAIGRERRHYLGSWENITTILEAAGSSLDRAVKMNVILARSADFAAMNEIYKTYFPDGKYPARTTIEARLAREELLVEIECVAEAREAGR